MTLPSDNPLLAPWDREPRPAALRPDQAGALPPGLRRHHGGADGRRSSAIAQSAEPPTFANTIVALETSGLDLERVAAVFFHLASADTNEALQAVEREIAPLLARHGNAIYLERGAVRPHRRALAERATTLGLDDEQRQVLDRYHTIFVRAGAALDEAGKKRLAEIGERLAALGTQFSQNVLAAENGFHLVLERGRSRRPAGFGALGGGGGGARARPRRANTSSRCRARRSSRSCSSPPAAICARRRSRPG